MKKLFLLSMPVLLILLGSCKNEFDYSLQLEEEQQKIDAYIQANGITVINVFPADSVFPEKTYYRANADSIFFRLDSKGTGDVAVAGDKIAVRYIESTLDEYPMVESYWTTQDLEYPTELTYGSTYRSCVGWQSAFDKMQRTDAVAEIIVPSKLGLAKATTATSVTPYHYKIKFKILPK
ncbi:MAG: DUF4827 domain-containing protein [Prevotellaceae bacterium]|jgi:hypothetical protein|nr:DUF4827 domain-containing protein [Prevotellaceae bacterium]